MPPVECSPSHMVLAAACSSTASGVDVHTAVLNIGGLVPYCMGVLVPGRGVVIVEIFPGSL